MAEEGTFGDPLVNPGEGTFGDPLSGQEVKEPIRKPNLAEILTGRTPPHIADLEWRQDFPKSYYVGKDIINKGIVPAIEGLGLTAGATTNPILGPALGFGAAKKAGQMVRGAYDWAMLGSPPPLLTPANVAKETLQSGIDVGMIAGIGKGTELGYKAMGKIADYMFDTLPQRLYANAVRLPLSKKWVKVLPGHEVTQRTAAVQEGLRERVRPSEIGIEKAKSLEKEVREYIDDIIDTLSTDPKNLINRDEVLKRGLEKAYKRANDSSDPEGAKRLIGEFADRFKAHDELITPSKANAIKRQLYDEVTWGAGEKTGLPAQISETSKKGVAHELMTDLEKLYPDLEKLNETDAARINLIEALERSVARENQNNFVPLGAKVLLRPKVWPLAIWDATIGHPQVKTSLAFALSKANPSKFGKIPYPAKPLPWRPPPIQPPEAPVYRYNPESPPYQVPPPIPFASKTTPGLPEVETPFSPSQLAIAKGLRTPTAREVAIQDIADEQAKIIKPVSERERIQNLPKGQIVPREPPALSEEIRTTPKLGKKGIPGEAIGNLERINRFRESKGLSLVAPGHTEEINQAEREIVTDKINKFREKKGLPPLTIAAVGAGLLGMVKVKAVEAETGKETTLYQTAQDALFDVNRRREGLTNLFEKARISSLSKSLKGIDLSNIEKTMLQRDAADYRSEGFTAQESNLKAINDWLTDLEDEENDILSQIGGEK